MLGGYRKRLPAYASTYHGDRNGGLDSKEAFADFAQQCHEMGYRAFKIHGWNDGNAREEAENLLHVRRVVGDRMNLMIDPACELRTFADALVRGARLRRSELLLVRGPVPRQRHLGLRAQEAARDDQDADPADRARARAWSPRPTS